MRRKVACLSPIRQGPIMACPEPLAATLADLAPVLAQHTRHDWWIIASAAVVLHGFDPGPVGDVDVLLDRRDAPAVFATLGLPDRLGESNAQFRSEHFAIWRGSAMPVELMAGFQLHEDGEWREIRLQSRQFVQLGDHNLFVPERHELRELFNRFGRPKDLARAALL
jgi:hypothetical protein